MSKKILDSKLLYAVLAIVIAIGLWFYVNSAENPDGDIEISRIPITVQNQNSLDVNDLVITDGLDKTVTLKMVGSRTTLAKLNKEKSKIKVFVDVSKITEPGEKILDYTVKLPSGYENSVNVTKRNPTGIILSVSRLIEKEFPVEVEFKGTLAQGYMKGEVAVTPKEITITGLEEEVNSIDRVVVTIKGEQLTNTVEADMAFELLDKDGKVLSNLDLDCSADTVKVTMPVIKTVDLPLVVDLIPGGGISDVNQFVHYTINPQSITVSGDENALAGLNKIVLGEIRLAEVMEKETFEYDIELPSDLENVSGITTATVTVEVTGLETTHAEVTNIELTNVPKGFHATSVTKSLNVIVRGTKDALGVLKDHTLTAKADLREIDTAAGRYTVPVEVHLTGLKDAGVVGSTYKIVVDLVHR